MVRLWPVLALLLAGGAAFLLLGGNDDGAGSQDALTREAAEGARGELIGVGPDPREARPEPGPAPEPPPPTPPQQSEVVVFLSGLVLDDETGAPLPGARVFFEGAQAPCPRLPLSVGRFEEGGMLRSRWGVLVATTDEAGRYALKARAADAPDSGTVDVFAEAGGRVLGVACAPRLPGEHTFRLLRGMSIRGRVADPRGRAVAGAEVWARPGPQTPTVPGHSAVGTTDERGDVALEGLLAGDVLVEIDHPWYFPSTTGPYDPARDSDVTFVLTPALRTTFRIRSDDGRPLKNVTGFWRTAGPAPREELRLLACQPLEAKGEAGGEISCEPLRIPCDGPSVTLEVKADGYAPWRLEGEPLPPEGGERTFDVVLGGDASLGALRVVLEDERGQGVGFAKSRVEVGRVTRMDGMPVPAGFVLEAAEDLRFPALPQGPYRILLRGPEMAPVEIDATAVAGRETEVRATVRPPAKVRVKFVSPERVIVRFRLTQGGRPVVAVPEGAPAAGADPGQKEPVYSAGDQGLLLSGLSTGTYLIVVEGEEATAPPTSVRLEEGQTEEIEIDVRPR